MRSKDFFRVTVENGVALLDQTGVKWRTKLQDVPITEINLLGCNTCILGHIFGSYQKGMKELKLDPNAGHAVAYGFATGYIHKDHAMTLLRTWKRAARKPPQHPTHIIFQ